MEASAPQEYTTGFFASRDGTRISYRQMGHGPGLILVHGAMQAAQNFMKLGAALSDSFTVYILNRRGRSLSGSFGEDYGIQTEVDDLNALIAMTGAQNVFGLSSGAIITLQTALASPSLRRIALYEPPLVVEGAPSPMFWTPRYEKEIARDDLAAAMVTCMKGAGDRGDLFTALPRFILVPLMRMALKSDGKSVKAEDASLESLIRSVHFDIRIVAQMAGTLESFRAIGGEVLLIGGARSAAFLPAALEALNSVLPHVRRAELSGLGHLAADDTGQPEHVAKELRFFFEGTLTSHSM